LFGGGTFVRGQIAQDGDVAVLQVGTSLNAYFAGRSLDIKEPDRSICH
jgi:hypothetical protein